MKPAAFRKAPFGMARAAVGHMPFPGHRTCAQWGKARSEATEYEPRAIRTDLDRINDAKIGSRRLREAIRRVA